MTSVNDLETFLDKMCKKIIQINKHGTLIKKLMDLIYRRKAIKIYFNWFRLDCIRKFFLVISKMENATFFLI